MSIRNLHRLFHPRSIAVIGASGKPLGTGAVVMRNLLAGGFDGPILPVNPNRAHVAGVLCYPNVESLPMVPDMAVICSPSDTVAEQIIALGRRGVRAAVAITGGYSHSYPLHGPALLDGIRTAARDAGIRLLGPNCLGLVVPGSRLNASFSHVSALPGKLGFVSRTAGMCAAVLDWARPRNIGFSACLSLGDCADIDYGDAIDYLALDTQTRAILLFLEDLTERGNVLSAIRSAARTKPVLFIKRPHITPPPSHPTSVTSALATADDVADAALRRAGALRVTYIDELFDAVNTLAGARPLTHERLTILTNSGTLAAIAKDEVLGARGELASLPPETMRQLESALPFAWSRTNPVDILIDASGDRYAAALGILLEDDSLDRILVINSPTGVVSSEEAALAVIGAIGRAGGRGDGRADGRTDGNVMTSWVGEETAASTRRLFTRAGIPSYDSPARAAKAFLHVVHHRRNQAMLIETPPSIFADLASARPPARAIVKTVLSEGRSVLTDRETMSLLAAYGIIIGDPGPGPGLVQARQLMIGATVDQVFGPVILFGEGGEAAEVSRDYAIALPPLNLPLARDLTSRTRIHRAIAAGGERSQAGLAAINSILIRVSQLIIDLPELIDLDINPILIGGLTYDGPTNEYMLRLNGARMRVAPASTEAHRRLAIRPYPQDLEEIITLRNGNQVLFRPIRPEDEPAHHAFIAKLTPEDIRSRFFGFVRGLDHNQMARLTQIDYDREMAFIATVSNPPGTNQPGQDHDGGEPSTLGVVRTITDSDNMVAEFSMVVRSDLKGQGLGSRLLNKMISYCRSCGTREIEGQVLLDNRDMLRLMRKLGFSLRLDSEEDVMQVKLTLQ
ncbi:MAG: bifunctional acetate--CoA ligase family protein/GNAT family N-acetyltransferase [Rhodospirillaceae bacterium]